MYRLPDDQRHRLTIFLLVALRKLGGRFEVTKEDVKWTKNKNIEVVSKDDTDHVKLLEPVKQMWPK